MEQVAVYAVLAAGGFLVALWTLHAFWRGVGWYRIAKAGPRRLIAPRHRLWRHPGHVERLDLTAAPGGPETIPVPPFKFVEEHTTGSQPCVSVTDARGRRWRAKWGPEVPCETFAVRFAHACGYFAEVTHLVRSGCIEGAAGLGRAGSCVETDGRFVDARFELDDPAVRKLFEEHSWAWNDNPFVGTRELNGLKMVVMVLSNWDTKDRRDVARGSNTAIFEHRLDSWRPEARYLITDWGGSMGKWGSNIVTRGRWDVDGFEAQTPGFVAGVQDGCLKFAYAGQRTADVADGITVDDARWFYRYARRLTEQQLRAALDASGATDDEATRFAAALKDRIQQIGRAAGA